MWSFYLSAGWNKKLNEEHEMDKNIFIRADELAVELDVSKALAYKMINQ